MDGENHTSLAPMVFDSDHLSTGRDLGSDACTSQGSEPKPGWQFLMTTAEQYEQDRALNSDELGHRATHRLDGIAGGDNHLVCVRNPHILEMLLVLQKPGMPSPYLLRFNASHSKAQS